MTLGRIILLLFVLIMGAAYQQYQTFRDQRVHLSQLSQEIGRLAYLIEKAMYEEESLRKQLATLVEQREALRQQLPLTISLEEEEQRVREIADNAGVKILALKSALSSKSLYREAFIYLTAEGEAKQMTRFIQRLQAEPRLSQLESRHASKGKSAEITLTLFSVDDRGWVLTPLPQCEDAPGGVWLPPLREELAKRYEDYAEKCRFVGEYGELYHLQQQLHQEREEVKRLQRIARQLSSAPHPR